MRWLVTGLRGTLAPVLARRAQALGHEVLGWRRDEVAPDDAAAGDAWLRRVRPDAIAHLGMGSEDWAARLAAHAARRGIPFLFTSTAMVFHHQPDGPHGVADERNAQDPYGQYKRACEDAVRAACPAACIARLGWQIDPRQPGNNMLMALDQWQASGGEVRASRSWRPACSFMEDTAAALAGLLLRPMAGVIHIDSNADEGHDFLRIVLALKQAFGREGWRVTATDEYVHDQRLAGGAQRVPALSARLAMLRQSPGGAA